MLKKIDITEKNIVLYMYNTNYQKVDYLIVRLFLLPNLHSSKRR